MGSAPGSGRCQAGDGDASETPGPAACVSSAGFRLQKLQAQLQQRGFLAKEDAFAKQHVGVAGLGEETPLNHGRRVVKRPRKGI